MSAGWFRGGSGTWTCAREAVERCAAERVLNEKDPPKRVPVCADRQIAVRKLATGFVQWSPCFRRDPCVAR
jgi:hypothetical protein